MQSQEHQAALDRLEAQHAEHMRAGRSRQATWTRHHARRYCAEHAIDPAPEWCRVGATRSAEPAPTLAAPIVASTGPIEVPRYDSLRAWAKAARGASSRVVCWHPQADGAMHVSLVIVETEELRKRSRTYDSEADALEALAQGTVRWQAPRKAAPKLTAGGRKRQPSAFGTFSHRT